MLRRYSRFAASVSAAVDLLSVSPEALEHRILLAATPLLSGQTVMGTLSSTTQIDEYTFYAQAGEPAVRVQAVTSSGGFPLSITETTPSGQVYRSYGPGGSSIASRFSETGIYRYSVTSPAQAGLGYAFTIFSGREPQQYEADESGQLINGSKTGRIRFGDIDPYYFDANAGDAFQLTGTVGTSGSEQMRIFVFQPDGAFLPLVGNAPGHTVTLGSTSLPQSGRYAVVVINGGITAEFHYSLSAQLPAGQGTPIIGVDVDPVQVSEDGPDLLRYTFTRANNLSTPLTVHFKVSGLAVAGQDYYTSGATGFNGQTGAMTFVPGELRKVFVVSPIDDTVIEPSENVRVDITAGSYRIGYKGGVGALILNDDPTPQVSLAVDAPVVLEDGPALLRYTFTRTGSLNTPLKVNFRAGGLAVAGQDFYTSGATGFNGKTGIIAFAAGETRKLLVVSPIDDTEIEPNENVRIDVTAGNGYLIGSASGVGAQILNDDPAVTLTVESPGEREYGLNHLRYIFRRTGSTVNAMTVNFRASGTAVAGQDYFTTGATSFNGRIGVMTIPAGERTAAFSVTPADDSIVEPDETVTIEVTAGSGYFRGSPSTATSLILNDDPTPTFAITVAPAEVQEDWPNTLNFTVTRTGSTDVPVTIQFRASGTATSGTDYSLFSADTFDGTFGSLSFAVGQTRRFLQVSPRFDMTVEPDETVQIEILAENGYLVGSAASSTGVIRNDDIPGGSPFTPPRSMSAAVAGPAVPAAVPTTPLRTPQIAAAQGQTSREDRSEPYSADLEAPVSMPRFVSADWTEITELLLTGLPV